MSLRGTQVFLARYLREADFREQCKAKGVAAFQDELDLDDAELALVEGIDLAQLDVSAHTILRERAGRTGAVFGALLDELSRFVDMDAFYAEYDRLYCEGWWQRSFETRRFETFATEFIIRGGLPQYLIDLTRLCSSITRMSDTPKVKPSGANVDPEGLQTVAPTFKAWLREPFERRRYRHDVPSLLEATESTGTPRPRPTSVVIQRDWRQHKRARIFDLADRPLIAALAEGPATSLELGERLPDWSHAHIVAGIADLYGDMVVHLEVPQAVVAEYTTRQRGQEGK